MIGLLAGLAGAAPAPEPPVNAKAPETFHCPRVRRGSPHDGVTTITVLQPPAACTAGPPWSGWSCALLQSDANDNGVSYQLDVRWNRVGQPVVASFTWLIGNTGTAFLREVTSFTQTVQDQLDLEQVRTIEIKFLGNGTSTFPQNGYTHMSAVYADVLEWLYANGVAQGVVGHFGNSGGAMMAANAMTYHRAHEILDGAVFGGGPFWSDMESVCLAQGTPLFGDLFHRGRADDVNWQDRDGTRPCTNLAPGADPRYVCASTLSPYGDSVYPRTIVAMIVGAQDSNNPWMDAMVSDYFAKITARGKSFDRPPNTNHEVMNFQQGSDTVLQRIREIVAAGPGRRPPDASPPLAPDRSDPLPLLRLEPPAPNPLATAARIAFFLPREGQARLSVHDVSGRRVAMLVDGARSAGTHAATWNGTTDDGTRAAAGLYFVRFEAIGERRTAKLSVSR
ncbi:MAG: FlgD immunoglobulin-like domain containing protein [Candidatus Eiseniibacteriota bacterium]